MYDNFFAKNDYRADRFQMVRDCSIVSIVNNRKTYSAKWDRGLIRIQVTHDWSICLKSVHGFTLNSQEWRSVWS